MLGAAKSATWDNKSLFFVARSSARRSIPSLPRRTATSSRPSVLQRRGLQGHRLVSRTTPPLQRPVHRSIGPGTRGTRTVSPVVSLLRQQVPLGSAQAGVESIGEQCALSACANTMEEAKKEGSHGCYVLGDPKRDRRRESARFLAVEDAISSIRC